MWLLIAEALLALVVLVFIVWWTMFSGRPRRDGDGDGDGDGKGKGKGKGNGDGDGDQS